MLSAEQTTSKGSRVAKEKAPAKVITEKEEVVKEQFCEFCGQPFTDVKSNLAGSERRKYCSRSCQSRACQGRIKARLAQPPSKRYAARLKFSDPLYFN